MLMRNQSYGSALALCRVLRKYYIHASIGRRQVFWLAGDEASAQA
jgi:hypothetical protein